MDWNPPDTWDRMGAWLSDLPSLIGARPKALLVISAHWESEQFSLTANAQPDLIYDYYGFPEHTYALQWPAAGEPALAARVQTLLSDTGLDNRVDAERGLDHGVFIPLKLAYPDAGIPVVQLSLQQGLDPAQHFRAGRALAPLRDEGVLIIGSGMSYHNMQRFQRGGGPIDPDSTQFDEWLTQSMGASADDRAEALLQWTDAPGARESHPREEHLIPLHVVVGAADGDPGRCVFRDEVMGSVQSAYLFGSSQSG